MLRTERDQVHARLAAAVGRPRELSTPHHLAHRLLDYTQHLVGTGDAEGSAAATEEACAMAGPCAASRCWTGPSASRLQNPVAALPDLEESTDPARGHSGRSALITPDRAGPE